MRKKEDTRPDTQKGGKTAGDKPDPRNKDAAVTSKSNEMREDHSSKRDKKQKECEEKKPKDSSTSSEEDEDEEDKQSDVIQDDDEKNRGNNANHVEGKNDGSTCGGKKAVAAAQTNQTKKRKATDDDGEVAEQNRANKVPDGVQEEGRKLGEKQASSKRARAPGGVHPSSSTSSACNAASASTGSSARTLFKKIHSCVVDVIVPSVKQQGTRIPSKTQFVITESDALRRIVRDIMRKCPKMVASPDRQELLVRLLEIMEEEETGHKEKKEPTVAA